MNAITELYEKVYSFEHNRELLQFKLEYRNIPMWPLIRTFVIQKAIDKENGIDVNVNQRTSVKRNKLVELTIRNPFLSLSKDILYLGFEDRGTSFHEDGLVYDERIMPYMQLNGRSCMLISHPNLDVKYAYNNWKSDYVIHRFALKQMSTSKKDARTAKELLKYTENELSIDIDKKLSQELLNIIMGYSKYLAGYVKACKQYLKIIQPKLTVIGCSSYMGLLQVAGNLACRDLNIPTAEIQHALEVRNSKAHHWGDAIIKSQSCQKIFPDYFLMLGEYWANSVALPSKKVVIGTHRKYRVNTEKRNNNVLICLSMSDEKYIELVEWILKNTGKNTKVCLRLHPLENTEKDRAIFAKFKVNDRFEFANEKRLEYYFRKCTYVISTGSTVIYEALTCGNIVFVPKDELYDYTNVDSIEDKIYSFQTFEELEKIWRRRNELSMIAYDDFYNMNYKELYGRFIDEMVGN